MVNSKFLLPSLNLGVYSALPKKVSRCGLKVFPPEVYTTSFGGDVKPLVPGDLV